MSSMLRARLSEDWHLKRLLFSEVRKKPIYTPHVDCGDYVIIVNAEKVEVTGKKRKGKDLQETYWISRRTQRDDFRTS